MTTVPANLLTDNSPIKVYVKGEPLDPRVKFISDEIRAILNGDVNPLNIMSATFQGVRLAKLFVALKGEQKKALVKSSMHVLVDFSPLSDDDKAKIDILLDAGVADAIDNFAFAISGLVYNATKNSCLAKLCCC